MDIVWMQSASWPEPQRCRSLLHRSAIAGFPSPAEDWLESLDINRLLIRQPAATFLVRAVGDSMRGAGIFSGDLLVVDRSIESAEGRIIIAQLNGELLVKRFRQMQDTLYLLPENSSYGWIEVTSAMDFEVWGVVVYVIHAL